MISSNMAQHRANVMENRDVTLGGSIDGVKQKRPLSLRRSVGQSQTHRFALLQEVNEAKKHIQILTLAIPLLVDLVIPEDAFNEENPSTGKKHKDGQQHHYRVHDYRHFVFLSSVSVKDFRNQSVLRDLILILC